MAVQVADAYIPVRLDTSGIDAQISEIEGRISALQGRAQAAANAASSVAASGGGGGGSGGGGGGLFGATGRIHSLWDMTGGHVMDTVRNSRGPGESLRNAASMVRDNVAAAVELSRKHGNDVLSAAKEGLGAAIMGGTIEGVSDSSGKLSDAMRKAVDDAIKAGQDEAEIRSPSARAARELGSPIMAGVVNEVKAGGQGVADAMVNSISYGFQKSIDTMFGGRFGNSGMTTVANPGGNFSGIGSYLDQFGQQVNASMAIANPQSGAMASRALMSNVPTKVRDFGQNLLSGALGTVLPGFAAGPAADMIGTAIGTKPILTAEQALSASKSADMGGLSDSPFVGGQFVFNNNFAGAGNFTDTERAVQLGILQSMRRLGAGF